MNTNKGIQKLHDACIQKDQKHTTVLGVRLGEVQLFQRSQLSNESLVLAFQYCHPVLKAPHILLLLATTLASSLSANVEWRGDMK